MAARRVSMWDADGGEAARCYAEKPYGHYKQEVYPLFAGILDGLGDGVRVLDVGAGPGHMAFEFYKARPDSQLRFALMDEGRAMLDIAARRIRELGFEIECFQRSYNSPGWDEGMGTFDAVVSNNSIFHVRPELLSGFYAGLYGILNENGLLLNQQSFAYEHPGFKDALADFPDALSPRRLLSKEDIEKIQRLGVRQGQLNAVAEEKRGKEVERLRAEGHEVEEEGPAYANLHVPASGHVACMRDAGFAAGCIWRKMEFGVLVGIKGRPFGE